MAGSIFVRPKAAPISGSGAPYAGAKYTFYLTGTSTLATVYTDSALSVAHSNPVIADANGTFAPIWLDPTKTYRAKLTTAANVLIEDIDPVDGRASSAGVTFLPAGTGAVSTSVQAKLREMVSVKDFGAVGNGTTDDTAAIQAAINACSSSTAANCRTLYIPGGEYKVSASLSIPNTIIRIVGDGPEASRINYSGVTGPCITTASITYLRPFLSDFGIYGNSSSGKGIDFSTVTGQVYDGAIERLRINAGSDAIYAPKFFSMTVNSVFVNSVNGHGFYISCGPSVSFINCYAVSVGTGKAGYRLLGGIYLYSCNGMDGGDWWGVFGKDSAATDGFQNDFPTISTNYPSVHLFGCNVEYFEKGGILLHESFANFEMIGGGFDRTAKTTAYTSALMWRKSSTRTGGAIRTSLDYINLGTGVPNGGASLTNAYFYAAGTSTGKLIDFSGAVASLPGVYADIVLGLYPFITQYSTSDIYNDNCMTFNAISPRRLTAKMIRYETKVVTPVGAGQTIDVTGYTKVIVTPAAAASITLATFTSTVGAGLDYLRNGDLIIEAGNGNLTINHLASGATGAFRMAGAANLTLTAGQVCRFCWSSTSNQWIQV